MLPTGWSFWLCCSCRLPHIFCRLNDWLAGCWDTSKLAAYTKHDLYIRIPDSIPTSGDVNGSWARQWKNWRHRDPSLPNAMRYSIDFSQYLQLKPKLHRKQVKARFKGTIFKSSVFKYSYPQGAVISTHIPAVRSNHSKNDVHCLWRLWALVSFKTYCNLGQK